MCGERVVWRAADSGSVSCFCQDCDFQGYAKDGTEAKRRILDQYGTGAAPKGDPAPKKDTPPAEGAKKPGLFGGLGL